MTDSSPLRLATAADLDDLIDALQGAPFVAIDTEFHAERRYYPNFLVLQLHVPGRGIWLVDANSADHLRAIAAPLRATTWVLHAGEQDLRILRHAIGAPPPTVWDTQILAGLVSTSYPASLGSLLARWLGQHVPKGETLSDWSVRPLSEAQLGYAANDVRWLPELFTVLIGELERRGRRDVGELACQQARDNALAPPNPDRLWRRVRGHQVLDRAQLAILAELSIWRETTAMAINQPPASVAHDAVLTWVAKTAPAALHNLRSRRVSKALVNRYGEQILDCVKRGLAWEPQDQPDVIATDDPRIALKTTLLAVAEVLAHDQHWSRRLVLPDDLVEDIAIDLSAQRQPSLPDVARRLAGPRFTQALEHGLALRIHGDRVWLADE